MSHAPDLRGLHQAQPHHHLEDPHSEVDFVDRIDLEKLSQVTFPARSVDFHFTDVYGIFTKALHRGGGHPQQQPRPHRVQRQGDDQEPTQDGRKGRGGHGQFQRSQSHSHL